MTMPKTTSASTKGDDMDKKRDLEGLSALVADATRIEARCASITCMIRHDVARRAKVIEDHAHNADECAFGLT